MAIRFHGNETNIIPRSELLKSLRLVIGRQEIADLVIPDLARWEDWSVLPRVVELFESADPKSNWVRVPIVNYVRACPLPAAKETLRRLEAVDPEAVRRASALFPFVAGSGTANDTKPSPSLPPKEVDLAVTPTPTDQRPDPFANQQPVNLEPELSGHTSDTPSRLRSPSFAWVSTAWGIWLLSGLALLLSVLVLRRITTKAL